MPSITMRAFRGLTAGLRLLFGLDVMAVGASAQTVPPIDRSSAEGWRQSIARLEPTTSDGWRSAAEADVAFVERALREHSPIGVTAAAAPIERAMQGAMATARARAADVASKGGYYATLSTLSDRIGDPHAAVFFSRNWNVGLAIPDTWWPGFRVSDSAGVARVTYAAPADSSTWRVGDVIQSCDGLSLDSLVALNVLPFGAAIAIDTQASRRRSIGRLFLDLENPFVRRPQRCTRLRRDSAVREAVLTWRVRTDDDARAIAAAAASPAPASSAFGVEWVAPDVAWIRVPSFSGDPATSEQILAIASMMQAQGGRLRAARRIVFDVRGNTGGSSLNGDRLIEALWSRTELRRFGPARETLRIAWRASPGNLEHWRAFTREQEARGTDARDDAAFGRRIVAGLSAALEKRRPLWVETTRSINPAVQRTTNRRSIFPATVWLLSDGACASACLDFADRLLAMPGTRLIGADTDGDGLLMEIRMVPMPSGLTVMAVPQKLYLNRRRGHLERYRADAVFPGPWTDRAVRQWVVDLP